MTLCKVYRGLTFTANSLDQIALPCHEISKMYIVSWTLFDGDTKCRHTLYRRRNQSPLVPMRMHCNVNQQAMLFGWQSAQMRNDCMPA